MKTSSESGLMKNVTNFQQLVSFCSAFGVRYTPTKTNLSLGDLFAKQAEAETALQQALIAKAAFDNAINARRILFKPIKKLSTRVMNALKASGASEEKISDAQGINRKIQGQRAISLKVNGHVAPVVPDSRDASEDLTADQTEVAEKKNISVSQQSYDMMIGHLRNLIHILDAEPSYNPVENELNVVGLSQYRGELEEANARVMSTFTALMIARASRNVVFFDKKTGLCQIAQDIKRYVRSVFGTESPQYKNASSLRFSAQRI